MCFKNVVSKLAFALCAAVISTTSIAGILGADIQIGQKYEERFDYLTTVEVRDDSSDLVDVYLGQNSDGRVGYTVNLDSNKVDVRFYFPRNFSYFNGAGTMNGLYLSGGALDADIFKATATITTNTLRFSPERIFVLDSHTVGLDFQNLYIWNGLELSINFEQPVELDEPASLAMLALGGMALGLTRRRAKRRPGS